MITETNPVDIDECQNGACHLNAECVNSLGSFNCTCHQGYSGDGVECSGMIHKLMCFYKSSYNDSYLTQPKLMLVNLLVTVKIKFDFKDRIEGFLDVS